MILTSGRLVHVDGRGGVLATKRPIPTAVEAGRLRVAPGLPGGPALLQELQAARGGAVIETRGAGHHGDLMVAVALALWGQGMERLRAA